MSDNTKRISIEDLPPSASAALSPEDIQPLPEGSDVKGGARMSVRRGIRRMNPKGVRANPSGIRMNDGLSAGNTWTGK